VTREIAPLPIAKEFQAYLKDASHFEGQAQGILFPSSEEEISQILHQANEKKLPITVSGAGTGLTGARVPLNGIILSTDKMNKILSIQWDEARWEGSATVQSGVSLKELEEALEKRGLFYPPNPGEKKAFIGGTVSTNASGSRSFKYGPTRRYVQRLRVILPSGEPLEIRRNQIKAQDYGFNLTLSDGKTIQIPVPTYSMPEVKNAAGYYAKPNMDLIDLFIGSEGTLGVVTEIGLKILKKPDGILIGFFSSEEACFKFASEIPSGLSPRALEFFDSRSLELLAQKHPDIPARSKAALFFEQEFGPQEEAAVQKGWERYLSSFRSSLAGSWISTSLKEQKVFREFRYHLPALVNEKVALNGFRKVGTDLAVPEEKADAMMAFYQEELQSSGIDYVIFGHLGDNNLHVNLLPKTSREFDETQSLYGVFARKAIELGGTISAEHGIGKIRIQYLEWMVGKEGLGEMARVKKSLDPEGILNPGNIFPVKLLKEV